jgi:hypothetical protein
MKKLNGFNQLQTFNLIFFILELAGLEYFVMKTASLLIGLPLSIAAVGEWALAVWVLLVLAEIGLAWGLGGGEKKFFKTALVLTHAPWILGFTLPFFLRLHLPDPHDFAWRKIQILFGVMWVSHLFLFSAWLLWKSRKVYRKVSTTFLVVSLFFFPALTLWITQCDTSGDEPHYLLMAYSLAHDGDLDLTNNYQNQDYRTFYHRGILEPQGLEHVVEGKRYSHHPLGPVLAILPGFWMAGRLGAALTIAFLAALSLYLTLRALEETGGAHSALQITGLIGLYSSPLLLFCGLIFPEIITACLVATSLLLFLRKRWGSLGVCVGLLLWMHNRNVLLALPWLAFLAYYFWTSRKNRIQSTTWFGAGFLIPVTGLALYFHAIYGVWTPLGAHHESFLFLFLLNRFFIGFFGLILDQECGLWFHFPIFALTLAGIWLLWKSKNSLKRPVLALFLFYYLFMSFYENLGETPAARFLSGVTPLLLVLVYPVVEKALKRDYWNYFIGFLFAVGTAVNWLLAAIPWMRYNKLEGESWILKIASSFARLPLTRWEPSFNVSPVEPRSYMLSVIWMTVTVGLTLWFLKRPARKG